MSIAYDNVSKTLLTTEGTKVNLFHLVAYCGNPMDLYLSGTSQCLGCENIVPAQCSSCVSPRIVNTATKTCINGSCHTSCTTCINNSSLGCSSCTLPNALQGTAPSECLPSCPFGKYQDGTTCVACHASCSSCNNSLNTSCLTCSAPNALQGPAPNSCAPTCPAGTFKNGTICSPCDTSCATCSSGLSTGCLTCNLPNAL